MPEFTAHVSGWRMKRRLRPALLAFKEAAAYALKVPAEENGGDSSLELSADGIIVDLVREGGMLRRGPKNLRITGLVWAHPHRIAMDEISGDRIAEYITSQIQSSLPAWVKTGFLQIFFVPYVSFAPIRRQD